MAQTFSPTKVEGRVHRVRDAASGRRVDDEALVNGADRPFLGIAEVFAMENVAGRFDFI